MKKFISILLAMLMIATAAFTLASCNDADKDGEEELTAEFDGFKLRFQELEDGTLGIAQVYAETEDVVLPAEHDGKAITALLYGCCKGQDKLKSIYVPEGVTAVYGAIFQNSMKAESISLPKSLKKLDAVAFNGMGSIAFKDVFYRGSQEDWSKIEIVNGEKLVMGPNTTVTYNAPAK